MRELSRADLDRLVRAGDAVFVAGGTGEPTAILSAWRETGLPQGVTLLGFQLPGMNRLSPEEFGPSCRYRTAFLSPALRGAFARGVVDLMPMHYTSFYGWLERARVDLAVFQVSPPDAAGLCNLGPCADFVPALTARSDVRLIAQLNARLPPCRGGLSLSIEKLEGCFHAETHLPAVEAVTGGGDREAIIAERAAALVEDGATVQVGIGRLPDQVLGRLARRRRLKLHGGVVTSAGLDLLESGAADSIVAGVGIGNEGFYARAAASEIAFRPVPFTHGPGVLAGMPQFMALNAALEVDLFAQANCEVAAGRLLAGFGGINDFMRAARASPGGAAVLMLPSLAANGRISTIVPRIGEPGLISVQRGDVDLVVTEHGVADLRGLDVEARALSLIAIAAPAARAALAADWRAMRARLVSAEPSYTPSLST